MAASFSLTGTIRLTPVWTEPLDLVDVVDRTTIAETIALSDGDDAGEADCYWKDVRTVAASQNDVFEFDALPLDVFGGTATLNIATLKVVYIRNLSNVSALQFDRDESTPITIAPGGVLFWSAGVSTTYPLCFGTANSDFQITNVGSSAADYEIVLVGVKA